MVTLPTLIRVLESVAAARNWRSAIRINERLTARARKFLDSPFIVRKRVQPFNPRYRIQRSQHQAPEIFHYRPAIPCSDSRNQPLSIQPRSKAITKNASNDGVTASKNAYLTEINVRCSIHRGTLTLDRRQHLSSCQASSPDTTGSNSCLIASSVSDSSESHRLRS